MLNSIIERVVRELRTYGSDPVYSAFDAESVEKKGKGIYTIVGVEAFESTAPVYSPYVVYIPFRADISVKVTAPPEFPMSRLFDYYSTKTAVAVGELSGLDCSLKKLSVKYDSNINRLVLTALLSSGGITRIERSTE
ncbi:MAG: hypothetical protein IKO47_04025 [Ruminococcus sp.]|nr:hypothetical protein [Ruminococcus sp.]